MGVYDRQVASAKRMIAAKGAKCVWVQPAAEEGGDAWNPQPAEPIRHPDISIAFFSPRDLGRGSAEFLSALRGTEVPTSSEIGLMAGGLDFEPSDADVIERWDGVKGIKSIDRLAPNGEAILYFVSLLS
ncbi:hypothetical protein [Sphingomonas phage Birtae]|nr:hypothetical protein [Sphingomonas phage Birtae]